MPNCCYWSAAATTTNKASVAVTTMTKMKCWWEYASTFPALAVWPALADKLLLRPNSKATVVASWIKNSNALHEVFQARFFLVGSVAITKCSHLLIYGDIPWVPQEQDREVIGKGHWGLCFFNWNNNAVFDCYTSTARLSEFLLFFRKPELKWPCRKLYATENSYSERMEKSTKSRF